MIGKSNSASSGTTMTAVLVTVLQRTQFTFRYNTISVLLETFGSPSVWFIQLTKKLSLVKSNVSLIVRSNSADTKSCEARSVVLNFLPVPVLDNDLNTGTNA